MGDALGPCQLTAPLVRVKSLSLAVCVMVISTNTATARPLPWWRYLAPLSLVSATMP